MHPINNRTGFQAQSDTIKAYPPFHSVSTESSHVSSSAPFGSLAFVVSHQELRWTLLTTSQLQSTRTNLAPERKLSNDATFSWVHKQVSPGRSFFSHYTVPQRSVKSCWKPTLLRRSMQPPFQHTACADPACTATHIHQSHWFHIKAKRFIVTPPSLAWFTLGRFSLPTRAFVF